MSKRRIQLLELVLMIESAEQAAHRSGFHETAQSLNTAKNKAGWECVYLLNKEQPGSAPTHTSGSE